MRVSDPDFRIEFKANTLKRAKAKAAKGAKKLRELKTPNKKIASFLDQWVQRNFKTEGGKVGGWPPFTYGGRLTSKKKSNAISLLGLSRGVVFGEVKGKKYIDGTAKLLQDTGALRISHIPFATKRNAGIGSDLPYSKVHDKGLGGVPRRRTLPVISEVRADIKEIYNDHVKQYKRTLQK